MPYQHPYVSEPRRDDEAKLNDLAQELYAASDRMFRPLFPWVFVRVLPRERITDGGIVLPDHEQNKTVHEGIVLATWAPVTVVPKRRKEDDGTDWRAGVSTHYAGMNGTMESDLKPGDHVLFPFSAGLPVTGFSDRRYRVVKETAWTKTDDGGGVFASVEYDAKDRRIQRRIRSLLPGPAGDFARAQANERFLASLNAEFILVERGGYSVTLSGR